MPAYEFSNFGVNNDIISGMALYTSAKSFIVPISMGFTILTTEHIIIYANLTKRERLRPEIKR
jgi:hypothetical protein